MGTSVSIPACISAVRRDLWLKWCVDTPLDSWCKFVETRLRRHVETDPIRAKNGDVVRMEHLKLRSLEYSAFNFDVDSRIQNWLLSMINPDVFLNYDLNLNLLSHPHQPFALVTDLVSLVQREAPRFLTKLRDCRGRISKFKDPETFRDMDPVMESGSDEIFSLDWNVWRSDWRETWSCRMVKEYSPCSWVSLFEQSWNLRRFFVWEDPRCPNVKGQILKDFFSKALHFCCWLDEGHSGWENSQFCRKSSRKSPWDQNLWFLIFCRKLPRLRRERNSLVQLCRSGNSASQGLGSSKPSFQPFGVGWLVGLVGWLKLMEVPGLTNIMEYFVKNYGTQSGIP